MEIQGLGPGLSQGFEEHARLACDILFAETWCQHGDYILLFGYASFQPSVDSPFGSESLFPLLRSSCTKIKNHGSKLICSFM